MKCLICDKECKSNSSLAGHIGRGHKISLEEYYDKYVLSDGRPKCPICGKDTRFDRATKTFKKYCISHANEARREWSKNNKTFDYGWKRGLTKEEHSGIASQALKMSGKNNPWYGGLPKETIQAAKQARKDKLTLTTKEFIEKAQKIHGNVYDYSKVDYKNTLEEVEILCTEHGSFVQRARDHIQGCGCPRCSNIGPSKAEQEIVSIFESMTEIESSNRKIIAPKEIDIFFPEHKFGIEYNGLYWHSEEHRTDKRYHLNKTEQCKQAGIKLFHIFSDEWREKKDIVQSMIRNRIGCCEKRIYARNCKIREVSNSEAKLFFSRTHISGHTNSQKAFALEYGGEIVCCVSLRRPWQKKYGNAIEVARFSSEVNAVVVGGFQKLLKEVVRWSREQGFDSILTYAERRFGEGEVYLKSGFQILGSTNVDYWYTDGFSRFNRFKFRAKNGKTEKQIAEESGVSRVYGCGSNIYLLHL